MKTHTEQAQVKVQQRHEHEDQEDSTSQLQEVLRRTLMAEGGDSRKHAASLPPALGQEEEQTSPQRQVPADRRRDTISICGLKIIIFVRFDHHRLGCTVLVQNFPLKILHFKIQSNVIHCFSGKNIS